MAWWTEGCRLIFAPRQYRWPIKSVVNKASASDSPKLLLRLNTDKLYSPEDKLSLILVCVTGGTSACVCVCVSVWVYTNMHVFVEMLPLSAAAGVPALQMEMSVHALQFATRSLLKLQIVTFWHHMHNCMIAGIWGYMNVLYAASYL